MKPERFDERTPEEPSDEEREAVYQRILLTCHLRYEIAKRLVRSGRVIIFGEIWQKPRHALIATIGMARPPDEEKPAAIVMQSILQRPVRNSFRLSRSLIAVQMVGLIFIFATAYVIGLTERKRPPESASRLAEQAPLRERANAQKRPWFGQAVLRLIWHRQLAH